MSKNVKSWYQSKTKVGAVLIALGPVLVTVGGLLQGGDFSSGLMELVTEIGVVLGVFGLRDLPFINKK